jgi:hypothetical protein
MHYELKAYREVDVQIHIFLISVLVGEWSGSRPGHFTPVERSPDTHWVGGWTWPRTGMDNVEKRTFLTLPGLELRPFGRPAHSQSLYWLRYPGSSYFPVAAEKVNVAIQVERLYQGTCRSDMRHRYIRPHSMLRRRKGRYCWPVLLTLVCI